MKLTRRHFLSTALAMPMLSRALDHYELEAAPARRQVKITAIKAIRLVTKVRGTSSGLVKIETDAGLVGYGPSYGGPETRAGIAMIQGRLVGQDPLEIRVHFQNMFYARSQSERYIRAFSAIDIALWDLAGKILDTPVCKLLGGPFRTEIETYSHLMPPAGNLTPVEAQNLYLSKDQWQKWAADLKGFAGGFKTFKIDIHPALGCRNGEFTPDIDPQTAAKVGRAYTLAREALGWDYGIDVHCHNELDVPGAIKVAEAIEEIKPFCFEDPLNPAFSESWMALRRSSRVPILTGENIALIEEALPFLEHQAVDILQPDLVHAGGITGTRIIADVAAAHRVPIALHNVSGYALNCASVQFAASVFNAPRIECRSWYADPAPEAASPSPAVRNGKIEVQMLPGLGIVPDEGFLKAHLADGEPWWG
jgi:L-alanine-DL-glutamate epimerase-like enolase superfamily enzyme